MTKGQKKITTNNMGLQKLQGKNLEITMDPPLDELWMLPLIACRKIKFFQSLSPPWTETLLHKLIYRVLIALLSMNPNPNDLTLTLNQCEQVPD